MRIGVDFDNTIVCYDALFHRVALEGGLIPADLPVNKSEVRNYLRRQGQEPVWTEMQGYVYGARMGEAAAYPGVKEFFRACRDHGTDVSIISHKTRHPFLGEKHDLHDAARRWLEAQGFFDAVGIGLPRDKVFFELTKEAKLQRIAAEGCAQFIDDLPELLAEPAFPNIGKILFDPNDLYAAETAYFRARSWKEISEKFQPDIERESVEASIKALAAQSQFGEPVVVEPMSGGGNNRVYGVQGPRRKGVVKHYFKQPGDQRDRFASERAFYEYLWARGIRRTPEPLAWNAENRLGLFIFVEGRKLKPEEVGADAVDQALEFILELNRDRAKAEAMPIASEACFSMAEHLAVVDRRVTRLEGMEAASDIDREAMEFARGELRPAWEQIATSIRREFKELDKALPAQARILSPSDFGFHNALLAPDGRLRFLDFEYAGWDDPAKLLCDFFCQPQIPTGLEHWGRFSGALATAWPEAENLAARSRRLLPAYQVKWSCIILNEFAPGDRARRAFAQGTAEDRKSAQLVKARQSLDAALQIWSGNGL